MDVLAKFRLDGRVALVTGGGRGIGRAIALHYAKVGADIVIAEIDEDAAISVAEEIGTTGRRSLAVKADVCSQAQLSALVETVMTKFGRIDVLVNNAGRVNPMTPALNLDAAEWKRVLEVCLTGTFLTSKAVGRVMVKQRRGNIINIASAAGSRAVPGWAPYAAAKAGVINFTKTLSLELARYRVRVNCISPGAIETELGGSRGSAQERVERAGIPLGRIGRPEDIACAAVYLASDAADWVTGACIGVNGGPYARKGDTELFEARFPDFEQR